MMLLSIYILLQVMTVGSLIFNFENESPLSSVVTMVLSGTLMVGAWFLRVGGEYVWNAAIQAYQYQPIYVNTPYLPALNMAIFGLSILFFFNDLMDVVKNRTKGTGNVTASEAVSNKIEI